MRIKGKQGRCDYSHEHVVAEWDDNANPWRPSWSSKVDFIMAGCAFHVALGNVWLFPYLLFVNGGWTYMIPYFLSMVLVGLPLLMLEIALGQYTSKGTINCWEMTPVSKGIGIGMMLISLQVALYYNLLIAWSLLYAGLSSQATLPFGSCNNSFNTQNCLYLVEERNALKQSLCNVTNGSLDVTNVSLNVTNVSLNATLDPWCNITLQNSALEGAALHNVMPHNVTLLNSTLHNGTLHNTSLILEEEEEVIILPEEEYFYNTLGYTSGEFTFAHIGGFVWKIAVPLLTCWVIVFLVLFKGVKVSGKIAYVTNIIPVAILIILVAYTATLEGSADGLKFVFTQFEIEKLKDLDIWRSALTTHLFSMGVSYGAFTTLASYNTFHNNCVQDALIFMLIDVAVCFMATLVIASVIGFLAHYLQEPVSGDLAGSGINLAFIVFPFAASKTANPTLMCVLFFICLFTLGIDAEFFMIEIVSTAVQDLFPSLQQEGHKKILIAVLCTSCFLISLPLCTEGGVLVFNFMWYYASSNNMLIIGLLEVIVIAWIYGADNLLSDIGVMVGSQTAMNMSWRTWSKYFYVCWMFLTPAVLLAMTVINYTKRTAVITYGDYTYPGYAATVGFIWDATPFVVIILYGCYSFASAKGNLKQKFVSQFKPSHEWGPLQVKHRVKVCHLKNFDIDPHWIGGGDTSPKKESFQARTRGESHA